MAGHLAIPYMGTKRGLAPAVAAVIAESKPGVVLDAFSGMCAIGQCIGGSRNIWNNDVQRFAAKVATALFTSRHGLSLRAEQSGALKSFFDSNAQSLRSRFSKRLAEERGCFASRALSKIREYLAQSEQVATCTRLERERSTLTQSPREFPYRLFSITFADGYFALHQAIEIDSARHAIDKALTGNLIDDDEHRWLLVAICLAAVRIATTTGHFAQFLDVNANNLSSYLQQRQRSFWETWLSCAKGLKPIGRRPWRSGNRSFNQESLALLGYLSTERVRPSVVYADPPYTDDQYSRYYHVWETLVAYDYPKSEGAGRYRPDRFHTPFSRKSDVVWSVTELIRRTAALDADLVLSYPANGLLQTVGADPYELLRLSFSKVQVAVQCSHSHSTMGASKGVARRAVTERIYFARNP